MKDFETLLNTFFMEHDRFNLLSTAIKNQDSIIKIEEFDKLD